MKKCPDYVNLNRKYSVDEKNPRIATKINGSGNWCTIIGNTSPTKQSDFMEHKNTEVKGQ